MDKLLYRGINLHFHEKFNGELQPKDNQVFSRSPEWDRAEWGNAFFGNNEANAVIEHQQHQAGYPTSGISTTPIIERANYYASGGGKYEAGIIYVIDPNICKALNVSLYVVSEIVPHPSIPEDEEIILVAQDFGVLPVEVIVDVQRFNT